MSSVPPLPEDAIVNCTVQIDQWIDLDGQCRTRVFYDGHIPRSQVVGLLAIAAMDVWNRTEDD